MFFSLKTDFSVESLNILLIWFVAKCPQESLCKNTNLVSWIIHFWKQMVWHLPGEQTFPNNPDKQRVPSSFSEIPAANFSWEKKNYNGTYVAAWGKVR